MDGTFFNVKISHLLVQLFLITFLPCLSTPGFGTHTPPRALPLPRFSQAAPALATEGGDRPVRAGVRRSLCLAVCGRHRALLPHLQSPEPSMRPPGFRDFWLLLPPLLVAGLCAVPPPSFSPSLR